MPACPPAWTRPAATTRCRLASRSATTAPPTRTVRPPRAGPTAAAHFAAPTCRTGGRAWLANLTWVAGVAVGPVILLSFLRGNELASRVLGWFNPVLSEEFWTQRVMEDSAFVSAGAWFLVGAAVFAHAASTVSAVSGLVFFAPFPKQYGARATGADVTANGSGEVLVAPGPNPATTARVTGYTYDGAKTTALQGFDIAPFPSPYGASVGGGDAGGTAADDLLVAPGPDPASSCDVRAYTYAAGAATALPGAFTAYPTMTYGGRLDGAPLGY